LAWISSREEKAEKKSEKQAAQEAKLANDATGAGPAVVAKDNSKSIEKRLSKIQAGAKELELWLHDLLRRGLAELPAREPGYWQSMAARMVDAQAAGLARELSRLEACVSSRADWPLVFARRLGRLNLLLQGCQRFRELSPGLQADLRAQLGWAVDKQEVLTSGQRVADSWLVLGLRQWQEEKLFTRWVWLWGLSSGRSALIIDFSHGSSLFAQPFVVGTLQAGELAYYPSACPLRALLLESQASSMPAVAPAAAADLNQALASVAEARARNPWQEVHLLMVDSVRLLVSDGAFMAIDQQSCCLPLTLEPERLWRLVALAGGTPLRLCAEWEGETLRPLSVWIEEAMYVA
jgi:hypothetical protein